MDPWHFEIRKASLGIYAVIFKHSERVEERWFPGEGSGVLWAGGEIWRRRQSENKNLE